MESSRSWECIVLLFSVVVEFSRVAPSDSFYSLSLSLPLYLSPSLSLSHSLSIRTAFGQQHRHDDGSEFSRTKRN